MKNINGKHIALSCIAIGGTIATCITGSPWIFLFAAIAVGTNLD